MSQPVLQIVKDAISIKGISLPTTLFNGSDSANQLLSIVKECAAEIAMRAPWDELVTEFTWVTTGVEKQFTFATQEVLKYSRKIVDDTLWNRSRQQKLIGPLSAQAWAARKAVGVDPLPYFYRVRGGDFLMPETAPAGDTCAFDFVDKRVWFSPDGDTLKEFTDNDNDTFRLDGEVLRLGVRWRYLQAKGLEYGEDFRKYEDMLSNRAGNNTPAEVLNLNGTEFKDALDPSIPEGFWNGAA